MGPGCGGSLLCMFNFHLRMPFMEQAEQRRKPKSREATNMLKAKDPEPGSPDSHPRTLSTHHATLSRERSEMGILLLR